MEPLKDTLFDQAFFDGLTSALSTAHPAFDTPDFLARVHDHEWPDRELKQRMRRVTECLHQTLPADYRAALAILRRTAERMAGGFGAMVFADFVEVYGLDDWAVSLPALEAFTQLASAEFAVRPFIIQDQDRMMAQMLAWAGHASEHVRRLASEGCRPRLPWAIALPAFKADPSPILPILERLKGDPAEYVRRSVANNLNDIAKDNPQVVLDTLDRWQAIEGDDMRWITRHALRTLVKQGDPGALALLGFGEAQVTVKDLAVLPAAIAIGEEVEITFTVESLGEAPQTLLIDYIVHLVRSRGQTTPKVFKLKQATLAPGETLHIAKKHSFRPISTRKYYPGEHTVEVQINGLLYAHQSFQVT